MIHGALSRPLRFLSDAEIRVLHATLIDQFGGSHGLRDEGLLASAAGMPRQAFGGDFAHSVPFGMAAAYAFHLCNNHPFIDGNKRIGFAAAVTFLRLNAWTLDVSESNAVRQMLSVAEGSCNKRQLENWLAQHSRPRPTLELRDFFVRCSLADSFRVAASAHASGSNSEAEQTVSEAALAIPMIRELEQLAEHWKREGNQQAAASCTYAAILLTSFYRIAEDMGYEW